MAAVGPSGGQAYCQLGIAMNTSNPAAVFYEAISPFAPVIADRTRGMVLVVLSVSNPCFRANREQNHTVAIKLGEHVQDVVN